MPDWTWRFEDAEGSPLSPELELPAEGFGAQADAESWIGEHWRALQAAGAEAAHLDLDGSRVYGPLSLRPA